MGLLRPSFPDTPLYGVLARFEGPTALYRACEKVRDAGFTRWDAHTPFPVHGLERAMGLRRSLVPYVVLVAGLSFAALGMLMQWWVATVAYAIVVSGKPYFSWPAFVPITFELGVLGGAFGAFFGMLALNQLPTLHHPLFGKPLFERASDDGFFISIEAWDPRFDPHRTAAFLREAGAAEVELVENTLAEAAGRAAP